MPLPNTLRLTFIIIRQLPRLIASNIPDNVICIIQLLFIMVLMISNLVLRLRNKLRRTPPPPVRQSQGLIRDIRQLREFYFSPLATDKRILTLSTSPGFWDSATKGEVIVIDGTAETMGVSLSPMYGIITTELRQWSDNGDFTCAVDTEALFTTRLNVGSYVVVKRGMQ